MPNDDRRSHRVVVTASEIGDFVFCGESWRLAALGTKPTPAIQAARTEGTRHHTAKATAETAAGGSIAIGRILIVIALLALVAWMALR